MHEYICGIFSGLASVFGKFSLSFLIKYDSISQNTYSFCSNNSYLNEYCWLILLIIRSLLFIAMLTCNILQLNSFLKALELKGSLYVTVVSYAVSFVITGILGYLILGEVQNSKWILGACLTSIGVGFISYSQREIKHNQ
jgi:drug/metabolite transporter (DMT)-like permease